MAKKLIKVEVTSLEVKYTSAEHVIKQCEQLITQYGAGNVSFEPETYQYSDDEYIAVMVNRVETDEEYADRMMLEKERATILEKREYDEYIRLAAKFE